MIHKISDNMPKVKTWFIAIIIFYLLVCMLPFIFVLPKSGTAPYATFMFMLLGFVMFGFPTGLVIYNATYRKRRIEYLEMHGVKVTAATTINRCDVRNALSKAAVFMFEVNALNPLTGRRQVFRSVYMPYRLLETKFKHLIPETLTVLIDPKKPSSYFVDVSPVYVALQNDKELSKKLALKF